MEERELSEFRRSLEDLRDKALASGNTITVADILACFPGVELSKTQIDVIYKYLEQEHINIAAYEPHDVRTVTVGERALTGEEEEYFRIYLKELKEIAPCTESEGRMLLSQLMSGDDTVVGRLIEGHLHLVLERARAFAGQGVLIGDLVQEGNVTLVTAIDGYRDAGVRLMGEQLTGYLTAQIDEALAELIRAETGISETGKRLAMDANRLLRVTSEFEEEYGRTATLKELAERMHMTEDEVESIMRISYSAMEIGDVTEPQDDKPAKRDPYRDGWM